MSDKWGRRDFLSTAAAAGVVAAASRTVLIDQAEAASGMENDITMKSASELANAIRSRQLSSKAIVEVHLEQIARVNPKLNAVVQLTADSARKLYIYEDFSGFMDSFKAVSARLKGPDDYEFPSRCGLAGALSVCSETLPGRAAADV